MTNSVLRRGTPIAVAAVPAAILLGLGLVHSGAYGNNSESALAAGAVSLSGLLASIAALRQRLDGPTLLAVPVIVLLAAGAAAFAAAELPPDLTLRTVGRPHLFLAPVIAFLSGAAIIGTWMIARGADPARAGLPLLIPCLALEGDVFGLPPAATLSIAATLLMLRSDRGSMRRCAIPAVIGLFLAFTIATWFATDPTPAVDVLIRLAGLSLAYLLIASDPSPSAAARVSVRTLLATLLFVTVLAVVNRHLLQEALASLGMNPLATELSLFGRHPNVLAPWFGATAVLAFILAIGPKGGTRTLARISLPCAITLTLMASSRLTVLAVAVSVLFFAASRLSARRLVLGGVGVGLVLTAAISFLPTFRAKLLNPSTLSNSASHRLHQAEVGLATYLDSPVVGQGPRCWFRQGAFTPFSRFEGASTSDHPHTIWLAVLVSAGAIGLAAFLYLLAAVVDAARRGMRASDPKLHTLAWAVSLATATQLFTNLADAGDAAETIIPSRLLIDLGILVALARATVPDETTRRSRWIPLGAIVAVIPALLTLTGVVMNQRGITAARAELFDQSKTDLLLAARLQPWSVPLQQQLVGLGFSLGQVAEFREHLERAEDLSPKRPSTQAFVARYFWNKGSPRPALAAAERAIELDPYGTTVREMAPLLANARMATGDRPGAIAALVPLLRQEPGPLAPFVDPDQPGTLKIMDQAIPIEDLLVILRTSVPSDAAPAARRRPPLRESELLLMTREYQRALVAVQEAEDVEGENIPATRQLRADILLQMGDADAALREIRPGLPDFSYNQLRIREADALFSLKRIDEARAASDLALATPADAHFYESMLHDALRRRLTIVDAQQDADAMLQTRQQLTWFEEDARARAQLRIEIARMQRDRGDTGAATETLKHALHLILQQPASDQTARDIATSVGVEVAELWLARGAGLSMAGTSRFADHWEHEAENRGKGTLVLVFRAAMLRGLGLFERARR